MTITYFSFSFQSSKLDTLAFLYDVNKYHFKKKSNSEDTHDREMIEAR